MPSKSIPAAYRLGFSAERSGLPFSGSEEAKMSVKSRLTGPAPMGLREKEDGKGKEKSAPAILSSIKSRLQKPASSHINIGSNPSAASATSSEISRPVQSRLPSSISSTSTSSVASGIRPPSKYASGTVGSKFGSSLPRPVSGSMSRLPAPAPGGVRSKLTKAGTFGFGSGASTLGRAAGRNV
ncbi:hypothetical protein SERLA73DRAFT_181406 [Serpula lacrymans var. lacrymans S7.3]|uniref:Uncharacterized protein n=2 Tax=Serpula lacrymans var. lacrymans TaxID=341189 RepID=F8PY09_SERL3|nr:uncharacterized protein SERLADRAFT_467538 [Serpula lacrymans var. lacrymans S7.9]EGN98772.1 hypothetical protein SERLA73DRAFT_181406 [Serpula lacrymans var. lacrymans S7.3]EGO24364.1 hypothetical protein SERLADRAFT_467538 [Serpula lacrymans var. lacrymans S7.9]